MASGKAASGVADSSACHYILEFTPVASGGFNCLQFTDWLLFIPESELELCFNRNLSCLLYWIFILPDQYYTEPGYQSIYRFCKNLFSAILELYHFLAGIIFFSFTY